MSRRVESVQRPWHPFRWQGMCGLRGTTCILMTITAIIVSVIFLKGVEKIKHNDTIPHKRELGSRNLPYTNPLVVL